MADVPTPLITDILSKLPVKSLLRFRCVSKSWRSMIDDPHFINLHLQQSLQNITNHKVIMRDCYLYSVDFPTLSRAIEINHPLKSPSCGTEVLGSCNGLLCLSNGDDEEDDGIIIYNPATKRHRKLPFTPIEFPDYFTAPGRRVYGFGYDHVHDDYKLVRIIQFWGPDEDFHDNDVRVYSLKSNTWKRVMDFPREYYISYKRSWGVYVNGCLHWVATRNPVSDGSQLIVGYELESDRCKVIPQPVYNGSTGGEFHLTVGVLQGSLYVMCNYPNVRTDVWVMKEYGVKESWTKAFSVAQPKIMGAFEYVKPLAYSKDGNMVLLERDLKELIWFDVRRRRAKRVNIRGMPDSPETEMMVESLVPLDNPTKKRKKKPKKKRNSLATFPEKLLCRILSKLPVKTLLLVQLVCKTWYNLVNGEEFIKMHLEVSSKSNKNLLLILGGKKVFLVDFQLLDKAVEIKHPLLREEGFFDILGSTNGVVCLCKDKDLALWNPSTGRYERIPSADFQFPPASNSFYCFIHGFGYDPTSDDYKLVSILQQHNWLKGGHVQSEVQVYSMKSKSWRQIRHFPYIICYPCSGVLASGALHWVARQNPDFYSSSNLVIAFDLGLEKFRVVTQPSYVDTDFQMSLGLLGGCLCLLCHYPQQSVDIWVMTDYRTELWIKLVSIKQGPLTNCFGYIKPLAYSDDGTEVLMEQDNKKFFWYNLRKRTARHVSVLGVPELFETVVCSCNLVQIGSTTRNSNVIHEQPSKGFQSKRDKEVRDDDKDGFLSKGFKLKL